MKLTIPKTSFRLKLNPNLKLPNINFKSSNIRGLNSSLVKKLRGMQLLDYFQLIELILVMSFVLVIILFGYSTNINLILTLITILVSIKLIEMLFYGGQIWPIVSFDLFLLTFISIVLLTNIINSEDVIRQTLGWLQVWEVGSLLLLGIIFYFVTTMANNKFFENIKKTFYSLLALGSLIITILSQVNAIINSESLTTSAGVISLLLVIFSLTSTRINKNSLYIRIIFILTGISFVGFIFTFDSFVFLTLGLLLIISGLVYSKYAKTLGRVLILFGGIITAAPIIFAGRIFERLGDQYSNIFASMQNYSLIDFLIGSTRGSNIAVGNLLLTGGLVATVMAIIFIGVLLRSLWTYYTNEENKILSSAGILLVAGTTISLFISTGITSMVAVSIILIGLIYTITVQTEIKQINQERLEVYSIPRLPKLAQEAYSTIRLILAVGIIIYIPTFIDFIIQLV